MERDADAYRLLFDANPLPMFVSDRETLQILIVNRAACEHYGWSREEMLGMTIRDMRPPEEVRSFEPSHADPPKDPMATYSRLGRHRTKDGRIIDVTLQISGLVIGGRAVSLAVVTDVTGIAQAERRFRLLVEHSSDGIALTNEDDILEYVSPGGQRILGYSSDEVVGRPPRARTHPDDVPRWTPPAPGETRYNVTRIAHRDGSWRWIESTTTNLTHDPAVRAYVSNYRDITERKRAEQELVESQQRFEFLLSATSAITYTARASGDYGTTFVSASVQQVLGYHPFAFYADPEFWRSRVHPEDLPQVDLRLVFPADRELLTRQYRFRHADGGDRWIRDVARVVRGDAGGAEIVGYSVDVTDQVRAEATVRRSEANFRMLIEYAPTAMFVHREGRYVYVNPAAVAMLGYHSADEIVGRPVLDFVHPDDRDVIRQRMVQVVAAGSTVPNIARMLRPDGTAVAMEAQGLLLDFDGLPSTVVIGHDVTERHAMFTRMALADRMLSLGTLAAGVAHEVNNPLAYIAVNLDAIAAELPNLQVSRESRLTGGTLAGLLTDARDGVARVSEIVRDLRALSRADEETRGAVDVVAVLASAIKMAHNEIRHRARVVQSYDDDLPPVDGDPTRLGQVFLNLLLNAAQAIGDGHADHNEIRVRASRLADGPRVRVDIADTGVGIAPAIMRRIFDPFFTTKGPGVGTGLGLSISHQIVRSMGGEVTVESRLDQGSTFSVILPVSTEPRARDSEPAAAASRITARILLVDDEAALGRALAVLLAPEIEVVAVTRAGDALTRITSGERFDVILCDLMMPEISGIELYDALATRAPDCAARMVFITGGAFTTEARRFLARVDRPHLEKPFSEAQLRRAIERIAPPSQGS